MRNDQFIYLCFLGFSLGAFGLGGWLVFFSRTFLNQRAALAKARLGNAGVVFFVISLRTLGVLLMIASGYLLIGLLRILPCALQLTRNG